MVDFSGQTVLVTGAGRGLGEAYATLIASLGATVAVHDGGVRPDGTGSDPTVARSVRDRIVSAGGSASAHAQDLASRGECVDLVTQVLNEHGKVDALIHSAGIVRYQRITETSDEEWERLSAINIDAAWWICQAVWPSMVAHGYGRIVLTTSGYGLRVVDGADVAGYSVSKAAQFGLMNALAGDGASHGILVNAVSPVAATRIFRQPTEPDALTPASVAPGVAVLASRGCPVTGTVVRAAGGKWGVLRWAPADESDLGPNAAPDDVLEWLTAETR